MKTIVMVLVFLFACLPTVLLAQQSPPQIPANAPLDLNGERQTKEAVDAGQDADILRLVGRVGELEYQRSAVRSVRDAVARAKIGALEDRVRALEDAKARLPADLVDRAEIQRMIDAAIKAAGGPQSSSGGPAGTDPPVNPAAATGLNLEQKLRDIDSGLSSRINGLKVKIDAINGRLSRRANRFDAGAFGLTARGFSAAGWMLGIRWPLGQDGDWSLRFSAGAGQGWTNFDGRKSLKTPTIVAEGDLLICLDSECAFSVGPSMSGVWGARITKSVRRYLFVGAGGTFRWQVASWWFLQAMAQSGVAAGTYGPGAPDNFRDVVERTFETWSGSLQTGFSF